MHTVGQNDWLIKVKRLKTLANVLALHCERYEKEYPETDEIKPTIHHQLLNGTIEDIHGTIDSMVNIKNG